jgi:5-methylcytosine-specific restriction endonuclease McrA
LQGRCKACCSVARRAAYAADPERFRKLQNDYFHRNKELVSEINQRSRERRPDQVKAAKLAYYEKVRHDPAYLAKRDAYTDRHKAEKTAYDRMYRELNAHRLAENKAVWIAQNKELIKAVKMSYKARRRAQVEGGDSSRDIKVWIGQQALVCRWCKADCSSLFHVDHVQPLSKGGAHAIANLCIACPPCNLKKNARDPAEFEAWLRAKLDREHGEVERHRVDVGILA